MVLQGTGDLVCIDQIGIKPKVPTKFYATLWDCCRQRLGLGPVEKVGQLMSHFKSLHSTCCGNARWGAFVIIAFFSEEKNVEAGLRHDWFYNAIDRLALKVKQEMSSERSTMPSGPVGLPAEDTLSPAESTKMMQELLAKLKVRK